MSLLLRAGLPSMLVTMSPIRACWPLTLLDCANITAKSDRSVERDYDIFEQLPNGTPLWRGHASGMQSLRVKLIEVASTTNNPCFAMHIPTQKIVARLNARPLQGREGKRMVFQIAYDDKLASARTALLRKCGYDVVTVVGVSRQSLFSACHNTLTCSLSAMQRQRATERKWSPGSKSIFPTPRCSP
jgi:hypothetical protein